MILTALRIFVALLADAIRAGLDPQPTRQRWQQQEWGNNEYTRDFRQEERLALENDILGPQYERDQEEPPRLTDAELIEEFQRVASLAREMGIPFVAAVDMPGHPNLFLTFNLEQANTQLCCAVHDLIAW